MMKNMVELNSWDEKISCKKALIYGLIEQLTSVMLIKGLAISNEKDSEF